MRPDKYLWNLQGPFDTKDVMFETREDFMILLEIQKFVIVHFILKS